MNGPYSSYMPIYLIVKCISMKFYFIFALLLPNFLLKSYSREASELT